ASEPARRRKGGIAASALTVARSPAHTLTLSPAQSRLVLWGFALSGCASLGYEVVWTRLLSIFSLGAVFSFTIMLATFLVGLAVGRRVGRLYGLNTLGSALGAFVAGFLLIPLLGLQRAALTLALLNLALGSAVLLMTAPVPRLRLAGVIAVAAGAALLLPPGL